MRTLLFPEGALKSSFPWGAHTGTKNYLKSIAHFAVGSFAVPLLVIGSIFALALFPKVYFAFATNDGVAAVLAGTTIAASVLTIGIAWLLAWRRGKSLRKSIHPGRLALYCLVNSLAVAAALPHAVLAFLPYFRPIMDWLMPILADKQGEPNISFVMGLSTISFVMGFGMQMRYIARTLRQENLSLTGVMGLNLNSLRGRTAWHTAWNLLYPVAVAYGLVYIIGESVVYLMGAPHQPTVEMARKAYGGNFLLFAAMAAIGAPLVEEFVFRGFLFQMLRSAFRRPEMPALLLAQTSASHGLMTRWWTAADNFVRRTSHGLIGAVKNFLSARPDVFAVLISSALFALMHMQFHPTTLVLLFILGCVHAELYRRTGSLWCSILLHCVNNSIDVITLGLGG